MDKSRVIISLIISLGLVFVWQPSVAFAHRSGCHNLHTCPSDSNTYTCGDLGYPCNGVTSISDIDVATINVPLLAEATFKQIFGRVPDEAESQFWKSRFRSDKDSVYKVKAAMRWHKSIGSFGPTRNDSLGLIPKINSLFRQAYAGRNPTVSENKYWLSRINDKPTEQALLGAMLFHQLNNIEH
jgi:hypothetical protein